MNSEDIRALRASIGETQSQFALRLGVTPAAISFWETGRSAPDRAHLEKLEGVRPIGTPARPLPFRPIQYLGSKQKLAWSIADIAGSLPGGSHSRIGDLFAGSCVVGEALRLQHSVTSVDVQAYSSLLGTAILKCSSKHFSAGSSEDFLSRVQSLVAVARNACSPLLEYEEEAIQRAANGAPTNLIALIEHGSIAALRQGPKSMQPASLKSKLSAVILAIDRSSRLKGRMIALEYFGGPYFSYRQAIELDALMLAASEFPDLRRTALQAVSLSTASEIVNTVGKQFAQPIKLRKADGTIQALLLRRTIRDRGLDAIATFAGWLSRWASRAGPASHSHAVVRQDVLEFVKTDQTCTAYYADPPYTIDHYSRFYHVLETLVRRDSPSLAQMSKAGKPTVMRGIYRSDRYQSPFCIPSSAPAAFERLFASIGARRAPLLLSYSPFDQGSMDRPRLLTLEALVNLAKHHFAKVELLTAADHTHRKLNMKERNSDGRTDAERMILCRP
jgi:adenine-specific DNA-methyltransferase